MGQRGPQSSAELTVAVTEDHRPPPPASFTDEQKFEWVAIMNASAAADYCEKQLPMLEAYCRHRVAQRHVAELIKQCEDGESLDVREYDRLLKMQERESRALLSCAVRLGFAHTTSSGGRKPPNGAGAFGKDKTYKF